MTTKHLRNVIQLFQQNTKLKQNQKNQIDTYITFIFASHWMIRATNQFRYELDMILRIK